MAHVVMLNEWN